MWFKVVAGCIPAAVLGLLFDDFLEAHFGTPMTIAIMLIVYGIAFIVIERFNKKERERIESVYDIGYKDALFVGAFQVLSIIPGTSRSGSTILGGMLCGISRAAVAEFSFFMAIPIMLGVSFIKIVTYEGVITSSEWLILAVGMIVSYLVSLAAIRFLMSYVRNHSFALFGWYRIVLGITVIGYFLISSII